MTQDPTGDYDSNDTVEGEDTEENEYDEEPEGRYNENTYSNNYMSDKLSRGRRKPV